MTYRDFALPFLATSWEMRPRHWCGPISSSPVVAEWARVTE
jgi:hypothetical protein